MTVSQELTVPRTSIHSLFEAVQPPCSRRAVNTIPVNQVVILHNCRDDWPPARNLGVDAKTAGSYIDLLVDLLLVRRLPPWHANVGKRLVKSSKVYVRDSGLVHALLGIGDKDTLVSHPVLGASWEGFVIEQVLVAAPEGTTGHFYRTSAGAEIDLLLHLPGGESWAIEIKRSLSPRPDKGFHHACADLSPTRRFIVYAGDERYPLSAEVEAMPLLTLARVLAEERR